MMIASSASRTHRLRREDEAAPVDALVMVLYTDGQQAAVDEFTGQFLVELVVNASRWAGMRAGRL